MRVNEIIKNMEKNKEELKYKAEHSDKCLNVMKRQLENNEKCHKVQQLEANKMKSTIEEVKEFHTYFTPISGLPFLGKIFRINSSQ